MESKNAEGVFSDSLVFNLQIDHFASLFPGSSLFLAQESPLVAAGHLSLYKNQIRTDDGSPTYQE